MPTRTIIDGYNLLRVLLPRMPARADALEEARGLVLRFLRGAARRPGDELVVVFDGRAGLGRAARQRDGDIEIHFSRAKGGADGLILDLVRGTRDRSRLLVVTSDREVAQEVDRLRGRTISSESFASSLRTPGRTGRRKGGRGSPGTGEKPSYPTPQEVARWEDLFREETPEES